MQNFSEEKKKNPDRLEPTIWECAKCKKQVKIYTVLPLVEGAVCLDCAGITKKPKEESVFTLF